MNRKTVAKFKKVSFERFKEDMLRAFPEMSYGSDGYLIDVYKCLKIPKRATRGSAGYDFFAPVHLQIKPGQTVLVPTGVRCNMEQDNVLMLFPRSGLGFKYRMQLNNTVGIIDSDYYFSDNEGHIMAKFTNDSNEGKTIEIGAGDGMMQGVFLQYGLANEEEVMTERNGGFGSTTGGNE